MAPEQFAGARRTTRSDIYALGLVLYEIFTGRRVFEASTWREFQALHESSAPASPSSHVKDIDPLAERVILRCLEKDPGKRPATAVQVALALPGGDPLQAALAAGETPSPEMVAATPKSGSLRPRVAVACLAATLLLVAFFAWRGQRFQVHTRLDLRKSPEVLAGRAAEIAEAFGYREAPADRAYGLAAEASYWEYAKSESTNPNYWKRIEAGQPLTILFWYRQSPVQIAGKSYFTGQVSLADPPPDVPGMVGMILDPRGRLVEFGGVPPQVAADVPARGEPDWKRVFDAAGLEMGKFSAAPPQWNPPQYADIRQAWTGRHPDHPDVAVRIEAAALGGRPVYFRVVAPWDKPARKYGGLGPQPMTRAVTFVWVSLVVICGAGAMLLARRNLRLGRGDRRGAGRTAVILALASSAAMLIQARHVPDLAELPILRDVAGTALMTAASVWVVYLALEPFVRRLWPGLLVGWTRLLAGEWRDPMVGRDVLVGATLGLIGHPLTIYLGNEASRWVGRERPVAATPAEGWRDLMSFVFGLVPSMGLWGLFLVLFLLLAYIVVRRQWLAALILSAVYYLWVVQAFAWAWPFYITHVFQVATAVYALYGFGFLAVLVYFAAFYLVYTVPFAPDPSLWYAPTGYAAMGLVVALALYGFTVSLGGQKIFSGQLPDDSL